MRPETILTGDKRNFNVKVGTTVPNTVFAELEMIAGTDSRNRADVIRRLLLRGLAAYREDGLLDDPLHAVEIINRCRW